MRFSVSELVSRLRLVHRLMVRGGMPRDSRPTSDFHEANPKPGRQVHAHKPQDDHHLRRSHIF
jgi:hypothetical protein